MGKKTVGFDLGRRTLKMVRLSGNGNKKVCVVPMPDNMVAEDGSVAMPDAMADFIRETAKAYDISGEAALILPASQVAVRNVTIPYMTEAQIRINLPYEFRDYLKEEKGQYYFDFLITGIQKDEEGKPVALDLLACAALRTVIEGYRSMFRRAGFRLKTAVPEEFAVGTALENIGTGEEREAADRCIVNIGHEKTRLYIFSQQIFQSVRTSEICLDQIDSAVAKSKGVDEHLARAYRESNFDNVLESSICEAVYHDLASEIIRAVNFYNYNKRETVLQEVLLAGVGSEIGPLVRTLQNDAKNIDMVPVNTREGGMKGLQSDALTAYGAAVSRRAGKQLNLVRNEGRARKPLTFVIGLLVIFLVSGIFSKLAVVDRIDRLNKAENELNLALQKNEALKKKAERYAEVRREYDLYDYGNLIGDSVSRLEVMSMVENLMMPRGKVTSFSVFGDVLTVSMGGMSLEEISEMLTEIGEQEITESVFLNSASTQKDEQNRLTGFEITINLKKTEGGE